MIEALLSQKSAIEDRRECCHRGLAWVERCAHFDGKAVVLADTEKLPDICRLTDAGYRVATHWESAEIACHDCGSHDLLALLFHGDSHEQAVACFERACAHLLEAQS